MRLQHTVLFFIACFFSWNIWAQQNHFIYIRSDNNQPFYVLLNQKTYSSSTGYVIISQLKEGKYDLLLGLEEGKPPIKKFTITIGKNDYGYALKNMSDRGWVLMNIQTMEMLNGEPVSDESILPDSSAKQPTETFGSMLSDVVNDSSLTTQSNKTRPAPVAESNEAVINTSTDSVPDETNTDETESSVKGVIKYSETMSNDGKNIVFIDFNKNVSDTVRILIPLNSATITQINNSAEETTKNEKEQNPTVNNPFYTAQDTISSKTAVDSVPAENSKEPVTAAASKNVNCNNVVNDKDILKLRKRIVLTSDNDEAVLEVKKYLKGKCITTEQVKSLGNLFLSDEYRYRFYDAVYPYVADKENFPSLESQLLDSYYKKRFKALMP